MKLSLREVVRISLSRKLIKNNQVDMVSGSLEIPLTPINLTSETEIKPDIEPELQQELNKTRARLDEMKRQAEAQAADIIRQAREQAESIKVQAKEEGYQAGFQEGRQSGYQTGYDEAIQSTEQMKEEAKALLKNAHLQSREYISQTKDEIISLAAAMAKKIIHISVDLNNECILEMVKEALYRSEEKKQVLLRCPAEFVSLLQANTSQFEKICPNATFIILEDPSVKKPGCVIETEDQVIDLDIDNQLENIVNALGALEK
jgi:flagellar assembly protein FliH